MVAKQRYLYHLLLLAAIGVYVINLVQEGIELSNIAEQKKENLRKRQLMDERFLAITKSVWPECVRQKLTAEDCKAFIDQEIYDLFTDKDRYIRSLIMGRRSKTDTYYNAMTILMNDNDMVVGRDGDGLIYYDFTWDGSGTLATEEQQTELPPIAAMEPDASLTEIGLEPGTVATIPPIDPIEPATTEAEATPTDPADPAVTDDVVPYDDDVILEEPPLIVFDEVIEGVSGATVDEFITEETSQTVDGGGTTTDTTAPIAGGVLTGSTAENTPEGDAKIEAALAELAASGGEVEAAGERTIEPIDCSGLTGENCCLLIKLKVRDSDTNGKAIQCTLNYTQDSAKKTYWRNLRGKKVHIFANHNGLVSKNPKIVGDWPKGIEGAEFESWLLEAGSPPLILQ